MNTKKILSIIIALLIAVSCVISVSAAELTDQSPNGLTEVTAKIEGSVPGGVSYIITIPDVVDFGTLSIPADNADDYNRDVTYTVEATKVEGLDPTAKQISVYVKDQNASIDGDQEFYIANKANATIKYSYDVYSNIGENVNASTRVNKDNMRTNGYFLTSFTEQGQSLTGTLRFSQVRLYGQNIADIAGDYSGYMVFFSTIENQ